MKAAIRSRSGSGTVRRPTDVLSVVGHRNTSRFSDNIIPHKVRFLGEGIFAGATPLEVLYLKCFTPMAELHKKSYLWRAGVCVRGNRDVRQHDGKGEDAGVLVQASFVENARTKGCTRVVWGRCCQNRRRSWRRPLWRIFDDHGYMDDFPILECRCINNM
jgi:hypothetical protein